VPEVEDEADEWVSQGAVGPSYRKGKEKHGKDIFVFSHDIFTLAS
jgi:hypothetical protein